MLNIDKKVWSAMALVGLLGFAVTGCGKAVSEGVVEEGNLSREPVPVRAVQVGRTNLKPSIELVGSLIAVPENSTLISPQIAGWIQKVTVVEGNCVRAGDELLRLDSRLAEVDCGRAAASVEEKTAILQRLKHGPRAEEIEVARQDARRAKAAIGALRNEIEALKDLQSRGEVSPVQFQKVQSSLEAAEAESASAVAKVKLLEAGTRPEEIAEAKARLAAAEAELATAKLNLQLCGITSPIDGTVTQLVARQGMYVDRTASLATIVDLSKVFVQVRVPTAHLANVKPGATVDVWVASWVDRAYHGSIARIGGQADPATGDVDALVEVTNHDGQLRPGLTCRSRVWLPEITDAIVVPAAAIADRSGTPVVSVVRDGKCYEVEVTLGVQTRDKTQVVEGIKAGDVVITEGGYGLPEGCPVSVHEDDEPARTAP